jgi:hypothetical protein
MVTLGRSIIPGQLKAALLNGSPAFATRKNVTNQTAKGKHGSFYNHVGVIRAPSPADGNPFH